MKREDIKGYDFTDDILNPDRVMDHLRAHDERMDTEQPYMALAKAAYTTKFWRYVEGQEDLNIAYEMTRIDQIEVNKIKPALTGYLSNLYPRRIKVIVSKSPYTEGDTQKAEMLLNDWINQPLMRERVMAASRQALLYKGAGAKVGYDPAGEGLDRVWMRVFPYWEMVLDSDVHDWDDARFFGHVSFKPRQEVIDEYGLSDDLGGTSRDDFLGSYLAGSSSIRNSDENADSDNSAFVRVLEFCNMVDDFYDTDGTRYKGRLEIYILDEGYEGEIRPVFMGPLPLVDARGNPMPHICPLIFEHEPEYPYRGIAYADQLMPQQRELNTMRSYMSQAARRDARVYLTPKGALDADAYTDLKAGEDGLIIEVDEQYAGNLANVVVPIRHGPVSGNIQQAMSIAELDLDRNTTISPAALGQVTQATASEIVAIEGHTQSEFGRHAEQRDLWMAAILRLCLSAHVAALYDPGDSEGGDANYDSEGVELDDSDVPSEEETAAEGDKFEPHTMYNEETGDSVQAMTEQEHIELGEAGYVHKEDIIEKDDDDRRILDIALDVINEERSEVEEDRQTAREIRLVMSSGEIVAITPDDIDSDFEIGFSEAGRSPLANQEMRSNILALSDKMLQLMDISQKGGAVGVMAEELLKTIHERFEFPANLSYDYIEAKVAEKAEQEQKDSNAQGSEAQPSPEAQPEQPSVDAGAEQQPQQADMSAAIAQIEQMEPMEALQTLAEIFKDNPQALELIERAAQLPPEQQAEAVNMLIQSIQGAGE